MPNKVRLTRRVSFSSGHRYWNPSLSKEENRKRFGPTASPYNHGHNYILDVTTEGTPDPETGMVVNIKTIDDILQYQIVTQFDNKSINDEIAHFQTQNPTLENLLLDISEQLNVLPTEAKRTALRLDERPTMWPHVERANNNHWT